MANDAAIARISAGIGWQSPSIRLLGRPMTVKASFESSNRESIPCFGHASFLEERYREPIMLGLRNAKRSIDWMSSSWAGEKIGGPGLSMRFELSSRPLPGKMSMHPIAS
jgi:hypothetical protein